MSIYDVGIGLCRTVDGVRDRSMEKNDAAVRRDYCTAETCRALLNSLTGPGLAD